MKGIINVKFFLFLVSELNGFLESFEKYIKKNKIIKLC